MLQTQLLLQIIANRVGLIIVDRRKSRLIKWVLFVVIGLVNISVFCIWIPAQMRTNQTFVALNHIWERIEKSIFLCVDLGLNVYFLYLVRSQLIGRGLTKYWPLFHFNAAIVIVSVSMDVLLLGLLSLPNPFEYVSIQLSHPFISLTHQPLWKSIVLRSMPVSTTNSDNHSSYVQFAPVAYTVKLNIELTMAVLISKVVRGVHRVDDHDSSTNYAANGTNISSRIDVVTSTQQQNGYFPGSIEKNKNIRVEKTGGHLSASDRDRYQGEGIIKTMTMTMTEDGE